MRGKNISAQKNSPFTNRAEEVRKRRNQRGQQRSSNSVVTRVVNPVQTRSVIVRGNTYGTPIHRQASTHPRRQFYVTMDQTSGTELRLPAIPLINPGWRLLSGLIAIVALVSMYSMFNSPFFLVSSVAVAGLQRVTAEEVNSALAFNDQSIVLVDSAAMIQSLTEKYPELINVQVSIEMPNLVKVIAAERTPVLAVQKGDKVQWVDAEGVIFPARGDVGPLVTIQTEDELPMAPQPVTMDQIDTAPGDVPTPSAPEAQSKDASNIPVTGLNKVEPALISAAQALSQKLPPDTPILFSKQNGLGWNDPQGWQVFIGSDLNNYEEKIAMYQRISSYLEEQGIQPALISVARVNAPFYRLEQ